MWLMQDVWGGGRRGMTTDVFSQEVLEEIDIAWRLALKTIAEMEDEEEWTNAESVKEMASQPRVKFDIMIETVSTYVGRVQRMW